MAAQANLVCIDIFWRALDNRQRTIHKSRLDQMLTKLFEQNVIFLVIRYNHCSLVQLDPRCSFNSNDKKLPLSLKKEHMVQHPGDSSQTLSPRCPPLLMDNFHQLPLFRLQAQKEGLMWKWDNQTPSQSLEGNY